MNKTLAFYFGFIGVMGIVGMTSDWFDGHVDSYSLASVVISFTLAIGLYKRYRVARIAGAAVCALMTGTAIVLWAMGGFQHHLLLITVVLFGLPLFGLLHPKARTEFIRSCWDDGTRDSADQE